MTPSYACFVLPAERAPIRWIVLLAAAAVLLLVAAWARASRAPEPDRYPWLRGLYASRLHPLLPRCIMLAGLIFALWFMRAGPLSRARNAGAALVWQIWWPLLALLPFAAGRSFCAVCPVMSLGPARRALARLDLRVPAAFRRLQWIPAAFMLLAFALADIFFRIEERPWVTLEFMTLMFLLIFALLLVFREWVWCLQLCPIGTVQAALARFSVLRRRGAGTLDLSRCRLGLSPDSAASRCSLCGDCWRGRPGEPVLNLGPRLDPGPDGQAARGEVLLMSVLLAHLIFEVSVNNDLGQTILLICERGNILWTPFGRWAGLIPVLPVKAVLLSWLSAALALVIGLRAALCRLLGAGGRRLGPEEAARFGVALFPLTAAAYVGFHVPAFFMLPELGARFSGLWTGKGWSAVPMFQASDYPAATIEAVRLLLLAFGWLCTVAALRGVLASLGTRDGPASLRRYRAECLYALLMALLLAALYALPATLGDIC